MTLWKNYLQYIFCFLILNSCISFERGIHSKLYFSSANIAVYKLEESPIFISSLDTSPRIQVEEKLIQSIFFTIRKEKSVMTVRGKESLWAPVTVLEIAPVIKDILNELNKGKTFFLVVKEEDNLSPYSRIIRTTFYLNRDGNILQMIFGEVDNNINFGTQFSFQDWANPNFFKLVCDKKKVILFEGNLASSFQFKKDSSCADNNALSKQDLDSKLESLTNYKWILVDLEKAGILSKEKNSQGEKGDSKTRKSREMRLKELKDLYQKGLINEDDYEMKKAEVLGEL